MNKFLVKTILCLGIIFIPIIMSGTDIFEAAKNGNINYIKNFIKNGENINSKNDKGSTALIVAAEEGHADCVKLLIDAKADINAKNNDGWTAINWASREGHADCVKLLIDAKADVNAKAKFIYQVTTVNNDYTQILKNSSSASARNSSSTASSTSSSVSNNRAFIITAYSEDYSPLMSAVWHNHADCVKLLMNAKADLNAKDDQGNTALMIASQKNFANIEKLFKNPNTK